MATIRQLQEQARREGRRQFHTGRRCIQGHNAPRYTSSGQCVECAKGFMRRYHAHVRQLLAQARAELGQEA